MHNVTKWSDTLWKSCSICCKIFKMCLIILRHYALRHWISLFLNLSNLLNIFLTACPTSIALIVGWRSYVATLGDGINLRVSKSNCTSCPPLKKNVTWAYFSVSKISVGILVSGMVIQTILWLCSICNHNTDRTKVQNFNLLSKLCSWATYFSFRFE